MREREIERRLTAAVKQQGGMCPKFVSPGLDGMPDRLILLPDGHAAFAEVKAKGKKPRALQLRRHEQLRALGFQVFVIDDKEQIPQVIQKMGGDAK